MNKSNSTKAKTANVKTIKAKTIKAKASNRDGLVAVYTWAKCVVPQQKRYNTKTLERLSRRDDFVARKGDVFIFHVPFAGDVELSVENKGVIIKVPFSKRRFVRG